MLEKSLGLLFYLKKPHDYVSGPIAIYLRITVDGIPKELSTKRVWEPAKWNARYNRVSGNKEDAKILNEYFDTLQNIAYAARTHLIDRGKVITAVAIRGIVSGETQRKRLLMSLLKNITTR